MDASVRFTDVSKRYYLGRRRAYAQYLLPLALQRRIEGADLGRYLVPVDSRRYASPAQEEGRVVRSGEPRDLS